MNLILPFILGIYILLFTIRYFVVNELNSKKLLLKKLKENSIAFIKMKDVLQKDRGAQSLYIRYNLITAILWVVTLIVLVIVIKDNVGRLN